VDGEDVPSRRQVQVPLQGLRAVGTLSLAFSVSSMNSVSRDIHFALSIHDVPSVRPTGPPARG
jgi:hypothetical protein